MSNPILPAAVRTALQVWWGSAVAWLATIGVTVPDETSALVEGALLALVIGLVTAGIRWLETRQGDGWQVWARKLAAVLMLGMSGAQPTYGEKPKVTTKPASRQRVSVTQSVDSKLMETMLDAARRTYNLPKP